METPQNGETVWIREVFANDRTFWTWQRLSPAIPTRITDLATHGCKTARIYEVRTY